jgi:integrase
MQEYELLLMELTNNDIITDVDASEFKNMNKRKKVLSLHQAKITEPKKQGNRWQTYVKKEDGSSKKISAVTEEGLLDKLYDFYFVNTIPTVVGYYPEWIAYRKKENAESKTIDRYGNWWKKYYLSHAISGKRLNEISSLEIKDFYHQQIKDYGMTKKELFNMKVILKGIMELAEEDGIISHNPFEGIKFNVKSCRPMEKEKDETRFYSEEEKEMIFVALNDEIDSFPNITVMHGLFFLFTKGLRISELSAIKLEDICWDSKEIYIHRMETYERDEETGERRITVVNYGKGRSEYAIRRLPLTDDEICLLKEVVEINQNCDYEDEGFLFLDDRGRTTSRGFSYRLGKMWRKIGMKIKSAHDIRRTVASILFLNRSEDFDLEDIRYYMGHEDVKTTKGYIYDMEEKEAKRLRYSNALTTSNMNGLRRTKIL